MPLPIPPPPPSLITPSGPAVTPYEHDPDLNTDWKPQASEVGVGSLPPIPAPPMHDMHPVPKPPSVPLPIAIPAAPQPTSHPLDIPDISDDDLKALEQMINHKDQAVPKVQQKPSPTPPPPLPAQVPASPTEPVYTPTTRSVRSAVIDAKKDDVLLEKKDDQKIETKPEPKLEKKIETSSMWTQPVDEKPIKPMVPSATTPPTPTQVPIQSPAAQPTAPSMMQEPKRPVLQTIEKTKNPLPQLPELTLPPRVEVEEELLIKEKFLSAQDYLAVREEIRGSRKILRQSDEALKDSVLRHEQIDMQLHKLTVDLNNIQEQLITIDMKLFEGE